jgi:hypothetical protein
MEDQLQINEQTDTPSLGPKVALAGLIIVAVLLIVGGVVFYVNYNKPAPQNTIDNSGATAVNNENKDLDKPITKEVQAITPIDEKIKYASQTASNPYDPSVTFYAYNMGSFSDTQESECSYGIKYGAENNLYFQKNYGPSTIKCGEDEIFGAIWSTFAGWISKDQYLIQDPGEIKIINIHPGVNDKPGVYLYDSKQLKFVATSSEGKYWMFAKDNRPTSLSFSLLDINKNVVKNIDVDPKKWVEVLYDEVNDGFVLVETTPVGMKVSEEVIFLSNNNLKLKSLVVTEPASPMERDCGGSKLASKPGEVVLYLSCQAFPSKYEQADGAIHLPL